MTEEAQGTPQVTQYRYCNGRVQDGVLVLTITEHKVQGDEIAEVLRQEMVAALERSALNKVVVDFRQAEYISSTAFRPLLALRRKLQDTCGRLVICGLSEAIGDVFYTTRMVNDGGAVTSLFDLAPDATTAVARLNSPSGDQPTG